MLLMLKADGSWDNSYLFSNKRCFGLIVPEGTLYNDFTSMVYSCIDESVTNTRLKIPYLVDACPPPMLVNDDSSLGFYLVLKKMTVSMISFLCVLNCLLLILVLINQCHVGILHLLSMFLPSH
ncbi:unnamed protein product [Cuscuta epithymum]|nr:unnamed protein product [Cuscuta epithymum]CAH9126257.1 unnamed protein product [Cuscuta epithymum]